jgi:hypothetical protein
MYFHVTCFHEVAGKKYDPSLIQFDETDDEFRRRIYKFLDIPYKESPVHPQGLWEAQGKNLDRLADMFGLTRLKKYTF